MQRKENILIWGFFSIVFIGANVVLQQQSESIAANSYLISAFISLSLTFLLDRSLKKREAKKLAEDESRSLQHKSKIEIPLKKTKRKTEKKNARKQAN